MDEDKKLKEMCPKAGWCESLGHFFGWRTLQILHNKCNPPCPRRNVFIRKWLTSAKKDIPAIYLEDSIEAKLLNHSLGQNDGTQRKMKMGKCGGCTKKKSIEQKLNKKSPSIVEQLKTVTKAGVEFVKNKMVKVTSEERDARLKICLSCPDNQNYYDQFGKLRCKLCSCFMAIKTSLPCEECVHPEKFWTKSKLCELEEDGV